MNFKFVARNRETGKTGALTVKAANETAARQKLELSGFDVVRLVRSSLVDTGSKVEIHSSPRAQRLSETRVVRPIGKATRMRFRLRALLADYFPPFAILF